MPFNLGKTTILTLICTSILCACHTPKSAVQAPPAPPVAPSVPAANPTAIVRWDKKMVDLGTVKKGEKRNLFYELTNTSGSDIQIDIVDACDCTTVDYPRGVIPAGATKRLDVVFNSAEKDAAETISINIIFKNTRPDGVPYIETVEYKFDLVK